MAFSSRLVGLHVAATQRCTHSHANAFRTPEPLRRRLRSTAAERAVSRGLERQAQASSPKHCQDVYANSADELLHQQVKLH